MKLKTVYTFEAEFDIPNADQISEMSVEGIKGLNSLELRDFMLNHGLADAEPGDAEVSADYSMEPETYENDGYVGVHAMFPAYFEVTTSGPDLDSCRIKAARAFENASFGDYQMICGYEKEETILQKNGRKRKGIMLYIL